MERRVLGQTGCEVSIVGFGGIVVKDLPQEEANRTVAESKRAALWRQVQRLSMQDAPWVPLFFVPATTAVRDNVQNFKTLQSGWWDLFAVSKK